MKRLQAWLDGRPLCAPEGRVILTDILEHRPVMRADTLPALRGEGRRLTRLSRESLSVTLCVELAAEDPAESQALMDALAAWSRGRRLRVSTRPGRVLDCVCTALPAVSVMRWTEAVRLTFTAWTVPFWQAADKDSLLLEGAAAGGQLYLRGTEDTVLEAEITALESVESLCLEREGERLALSGLGLRAGDTLRAAHDAGGFLSLAVRSGDEERPALGCREARSADEISLRPGANTLRLTADGEVRALLTGRGRWR